LYLPEKGTRMSKLINDLERLPRHTGPEKKVRCRPVGTEHYSFPGQGITCPAFYRRVASVASQFSSLSEEYSFCDSKIRVLFWWGEVSRL
jgi:hypothetical protein